MGAECPICGNWNAYTNAITATGEPAQKGKDIIARKLACGHVVGGAEYMAYREQVGQLERQAAEQRMRIDAELKRKKTALWASTIAPPQEA